MEIEQTLQRHSVSIDRWERKGTSETSVQRFPRDNDYMYVNQT